MKRILWALTLATLLLALVGCGAGNIYGAWQAQAMDGLVFEFEKDGGFSVRQPDDPGNVLRGSYTLVGEAGIEILWRGARSAFPAPTPSRRESWFSSFRESGSTSPATGDSL